MKKINSQLGIPELKDEELEKIVEKYDRNKDGKLNLDEFVPFFKVIIHKLYKIDDTNKSEQYQNVTRDDINLVYKQLFTMADKN